jgi:hypothetical protein
MRNGSALCEPRSRARFWSMALLVTAPLLGACQRSSSQYRPTVVYPGGHPPGSPAPGTPGAPAPANPATPGAPAPTGTGTAAVGGSTSAPPPVGGFDPINSVELNFLRNEATSILSELVAALPPLQRGRVQGIPLLFDPKPGEVNAFASCSSTGKTTMAITDGLLEIQSQLARARAHDEVAGTRKTDEYVALIARNQQPNQPLVRPAAGFFDPAVDVSPHKLGRQRELFDEQTAFVLGHELAHHYLGHLPCTGVGALPAMEVGRILSDAVPVFNQPIELAADVSGTNNALTAGFRRGGYKFTEGGAMLTMQFFAGVDQMSPIDVIFAFERSHPPPAVRSPVIQQTAAAWRRTGGAGLPYPLF